MKSHRHWGAFHITWPRARPSFILALLLGLMIGGMLLWKLLGTPPLQGMVLLLPIGIAFIGAVATGFFYLFNKEGRARFTAYTTTLVFFLVLSFLLTAFFGKH
jgi:hypothetical protein